MTEDLSTVDDAQLARWAYARPSTAVEADRAQRAADELGRRAINRAAIERGAAPVVDDAPEQDGVTGSDDLAVLRRRRVLAVVGAAGLLAVVAGLALPPLLDPSPPPRSSLDVFDREFSNEEREYLTLLQREGQRVNVGPRVIGAIEYGTVLAYRSIRNDPGQPERDEVCLAVAEYDRAAQSPQINDWQCVDRSDFETEGASVTLFGLGGQYDVDWGPRGAARLDVLISEAQRRAFEPGIESPFVDRPATALEQRYVTDLLLADQTDVVVEQLRLVFPLKNLVDPEGSSGQWTAPEAGGEWIAASTAVATDSGERRACLSVIDLRELEPGELLAGEFDGDEQDPGSEAASAEPVGTQVDSACLAVDAFDARALSFTVERAGVTIIATWTSTGDISALTTGAG